MAEETQDQSTEQTSETQETQTQETQTEETGTLLGDAAESGETEGEGETKETGVPETYDIKVPEGMEVDAAMVDAFSPVLKDLNITNEGAQKLADIFASQISEKVKASQQEAVGTWEKQVNDWKKQTIQELGPTAKEDLAAASKLIDKYGSQKLRDELNDTGFGNHPELTKLFVKLGREMSEDSFVTPETHGHGGAETEINKMYPSMGAK